MIRFVVLFVVATVTSAASWGHPGLYFNHLHAPILKGHTYSTQVHHASIPVPSKGYAYAAPAHIDIPSVKGYAYSTEVQHPGAAVVAAPALNGYAYSAQVHHPSAISVAAPPVKGYAYSSEVHHANPVPFYSTENAATPIAVAAAPAFKGYAHTSAAPAFNWAVENANQNVGPVAVPAEDDSSVDASDDKAAQEEEPEQKAVEPEEEQDEEVASDNNTEPEEPKEPNQDIRGYAYSSQVHHSAPVISFGTKGYAVSPIAMKGHAYASQVHHGPAYAVSYGAHVPHTVLNSYKGYAL